MHIVVLVPSSLYEQCITCKYNFSETAAHYLFVIAGYRAPNYTPGCGLMGLRNIM